VLWQVSLFGKMKTGGAVLDVMSGAAALWNMLADRGRVA
jgi:hypothetical protein